jgi:CDP-diacylglycerol--glycerol-3-phosphate 3-phosphatidyltransferase
MFNRVGGHLLRCPCRRQVIIRKDLQVRRFSIYNSSKAAAASIASPLGGLTIELDRIAPRFEVPASRITVLDSPSAFYETLKVRL